MRTGLAVIFVSSLAASCTRGTSASRARTQPSAALVPVSSAVSTPVAKLDGPALPLPPAPPGTDPERVIFAASVCAAAYLGKDVGCRSHPPFALPEQKPDGKILEHKGDPLLFCAIDRIFRGSFTRPGAKQAVVSFAQCKANEDATWDSGFPGSVVLVEEIAGRWAAIAFEDGVNSSFCLQNHRADGRDVLMCRSGLLAPPSGEVAYLFLVDFARGLAGKANAGSLAKLFGEEPNCMLADSGMPAGVTSLEVVSMALADLNKDGTPDLVVKVKRAHVPPSAALDAKLRVMCKKNRGESVRSFAPAPTMTTLEFLSDGQRFTPSAATKRAIDTWTAEAPEGFNGLSQVGPAPLTE